LVLGLWTLVFGFVFSVELAASSPPRQRHETTKDQRPKSKDQRSKNIRQD